MTLLASGQAACLTSVGRLGEWVNDPQWAGRLGD